MAAVLTEAHGHHRGLVRGGLSRSKAATWQPGNLVQARWVGRLPEQLGNLTAEMVHAAAARVMDDPLALAVLQSACATADAVLPEREPHPGVFAGMVRLIAGLGGPDDVTDLIRWELVLLRELGYGLDLSRCAITGETAGLAWVSPRSARAVSDDAAGVWRNRLLKLPGFLVGGNSAAPGDWRDGLRLTGHFLERDAFSHPERPLPAARHMLYDRVSALADAE